MNRVSQLSSLEKVLKGMVSAVAWPFGFTTVGNNTVVTVYRFGKFDKMYYPGFTWMNPMGWRFDTFLGNVTYESKNLHIFDKTGAPIIVTALVNYRTVDPVSYIETTNYLREKDITFSKMNMAIRNVLSRYALIDNSDGVTEKNDIKTGGDKLNQELGLKINEEIRKYGLVVESAIISEAQYAPEVMKQMLVKQQAEAFVDARRTIVKGAVDTIKHVSKEFDHLSPEAREKIAINLVTVLAGQTGSQPTISM